jgi:hypothetical protein
VQCGISESRAGTKFMFIIADISLSDYYRLTKYAYNSEIIMKIEVRESWKLKKLEPPQKVGSGN